MNKPRRMGAAQTADASLKVDKEWHAINWHKVQLEVNRLQTRIVEAKKIGNLRKVRALQHILTRSQSAAALAVKRVTENPGKNTPGIDGVLWNTPRKKAEGMHAIRKGQYKAKPLRRTYIPKANGKQRPLGIPTLFDRAKQALHLLALDPIAECQADSHSYGFRKNRRCADAIEQCFKVLAQRRSSSWILEADIEACFDKISHDWLLENIPMEKQVLKQWLKAGYIDKHTFNLTKSGTPQGGIASPVLANMTLDTMEELLRDRFKDEVKFIRYADDFVITGKTKDLLEAQVKPRIEAFLTERGLKLSATKTKITHIDEGFDFLGQNIRKYKGKLLIKPSSASIKKLTRTVLKIIKENKTVKTESLISRLNPILRGWGNYHRHVVSKVCFSKIDHLIWRAIWRWAKRRHPNKSAQWRKEEYYTDDGTWRFYATNKQKKPIFLFRLYSIPIRRHPKILSEANPYDPKYRRYFEERALKSELTRTKGTGKTKYLWLRQQGKCLNCNTLLSEETGWHLHHILPRAKGGNDELSNLQLLHPNCHRQIHANPSFKLGISNKSAL